MNRGKLIVLEGPDGCGKSTLTRFVVRWMQMLYGDDKVAATKEPGSPLSLLNMDIRHMLFNDNPDFLPRNYARELDMVIHGLLFFMDHYENAKLARHYTDQGIHVVSDRWLYSQYAYDAVKKSSQVDALALYHKYEALQIQPDLILLVDCDEATANEHLSQRTGKPTKQTDKQ